MHKGMAMGSNRFKLEIERLTGRRVTEAKKEGRRSLNKVVLTPFYYHFVI